MQDQIQDWLAQHGYAGGIVPMSPGFGETALWRVSSTDNASDLVLRMFPPGRDSAATREALAMRAAREHGLPVPAVVAGGTIEDRPVLLITFAPGEMVSDAITNAPERAAALGATLGELLGRLHAVPAPAGLAADDRWIAHGGPALEPLRARLRAVPNADRLMHLDYHPGNVLVDGESTCTIVDWANALPGPPHMDVARSRSLLEVVRLAGKFPEPILKALDAFADAMVTSHERVTGPDPHPELSRAWGWAMTTDDIAQHVGKPGSWVTPALVERLAATRDEIISKALDS